ncbi:MAG: DUF561 domain-containing protein [Cyanobacteria bacterium]|nr:DUF561 domain-containing protein [Cyanobacteriota bacterium]
MKLRVSEFRCALAEKTAIKVISGIANFDLDNVLSVVRAASAAGATSVDVSARVDIVQAVRQETNLTVFASCIQPANLAAAVAHGADVVEVGNYDALYEEGLFFTADDVLKLAEQTLRLVQGQALVSVTVPGHLAVDTQVQLAKKLEAMGVDFIQTEGASRALSAQPQIKALTADEKFEITLSNTQALSQAVGTPIITASGITLHNISEAYQAGASAVGVGSSVNKLSSQADMTSAIQKMVLRVSTQKIAAPERDLSLVS